MSAGFVAIDTVNGISTLAAPAWPAFARSVELLALLREMLPAKGPRAGGAVRRPVGEWSPAAQCSAAGEGEDTARPTDAFAVDWSDVRLSREGDPEAFARLVRRYQEPIAAYMWRFTRDPRQWEELVHDVFVEAYFSLQSYAGRSPWVHWLKRIATRIGYRYWKDRQRRGRELPLLADDEPSSASLDDGDGPRYAAEVVHRLLARLTPRDRLVMTLIYLESNSLVEVARLTGWTETMVKVQAHRARKRLAKICAQMEIEL